MAALSRFVEASLDDATGNDNTTSFSDSSTTLRGDSSPGDGSRWNSGMRFPRIEIPRGSDILTATLTIEMPGAADDDPDLQIHCEDIDDHPDDITQVTVLSRTTVFTLWDAVNLGAGLSVSPDFALAVQEVINRPGWESGNAVVVLIIGNDVTSRLFRPASFDHATAQAPLLQVTWTEGIDPAPAAHGASVQRIPDRMVLS